MIISDIPFDRGRIYDLAVVACGYERRSSYLARQGLQGSLQLAVDLGARNLCSRESNELELLELGWTLSPIEEVLFAIAAAGPGSTAAVDISALPRTALARIVTEFATHGGFSHVDFFYATGEFSSSVQAARESVTLTAAPVAAAFAGSLRAASIPIGLVMGIGVEPYRAAGLTELLEPARVWQFVAQGGDSRFDELLTSVRAGLGVAPQGTTAVGYPIQSLRETHSRISSLIFSQSSKFRMILAPSGPKIFALACLLASLEADPSIRPAVWRVGNASHGTCIDVVEAGAVTVGRVSFGQ